MPIIFLTARAGENDRVLGLELGADDYITKPFATRELVARVKAVLRRFERPTTPSVISFEEVIIDANAMQLKVRGELTTTTATEFRLLDYLARHPGPGLQPRPPAGCGVGRCAFCHAALGGRVCAAHPGEDRSRSGESAVPEDGARRRLPL